MQIRYLVLAFIFSASGLLPLDLFSKDVPENASNKVKDQVNSKPPAETPAGTKPAEAANPGQSPAKPAEPGNPVKPDTPTKPEMPTEPSKPADSLNNTKPPEETPSGTKPAEPANPGENPATPAEPGEKGKPDADKDLKDKPKLDDAEKNAKDKQEKKDKADKEPKNKKDKPGKGGKSGASLPSSPPSGAALAPAAGALGGEIIGGLFSGGKKEADKKEEKKVKAAKPAPKEAAASTETVKAAVPVQASTQVAAPEPLYSAGKGPSIAVIVFDGEAGAEFAALLSVALSADLKVYSPKKIAGKEYTASAINRVSVRKIAAELEVEYIVTGKVSKKSETLSIISVYLRDAKTGDIRLTDNQNVRSAEDLKSAAQNAAGKIVERLR